jgi:hypothetical protein
MKEVAASRDGALMVPPIESACASEPLVKGN